MKKKIIYVLIIFTAFLFLLPNKTYARGCGKPGDCGSGETCDPATHLCVPGSKPGTVTSPGAPSPSSSPVLCTPTGGTTDSGVSTAIGCVPILGSNGQTDFLSFVLKWAVGVGGGIAFLLILYGGFMVMTSAGNPERLKAGQELLTSAISGLILLIFSVFILRFIGIDILGLNAFGFGK